MIFLSPTFVLRKGDPGKDGREGSRKDGTEAEQTEKDGEGTDQD